MALPTLIPLLPLALLAPGANLSKADPAHNSARAASSPVARQSIASVPRQEIDTRLARFEAANAGNPQAVAALRQAGAAVAANPQAYLNGDGLDAQAMAGLLGKHFARAGKFSVPQAPAPRAGANVAAGDVDGDGAAASSGGVRVAVGDLNGDGVAARPGLGGIRVAAGDVNALGAPQRDELQRLILMQAVREAKDELDSMREMGEMDSLRLQMAMDRMSKMMSTLSNLLKKQGETSQSIIQNVK